MKPGATLGLSHGFLLGVMKNDNVDFRKDINVVLVAPKVGTHSFSQHSISINKNFGDMIIPGYCKINHKDDN